MNNRTMFPALKNDAGYKGPVKIEFLKGASLLTLGGSGASDLTLYFSIPTKA